MFDLRVHGMFSTWRWFGPFAVGAGRRPIGPELRRAPVTGESGRDGWQRDGGGRGLGQNVVRADFAVLSIPIPPGGSRRRCR